MENKVLKLDGAEVPLAATVLESLDLFKKLPAAVWLKLAIHAGLPVEPFDRNLLYKPLQGVIQNEWYRAHGEEIPPECQLGQDNRVNAYKNQLEQLKNHTGVDVVTSRRKVNPDAKPRENNRYILAEGKEAVHKALTGQRFLVFKSMKSTGKPMSAAEIKAAIPQIEGIKDPSQQNVNFHINKFRKEGLIVGVDELGNPVAMPEAEPEVAATETPAEPKKATEPKTKKGNKKK